MFRYRLQLVDGTDVGEGAYAMEIHVGDVIHYGTTRYRVVSVVAIDEPDSPLGGMLQVEPA